jgi:tetratricopeptide (TPR) repeat protein
MFIKKQRKEVVKSVLVALLFSLFACQNEQQNEVLLDSELITYFQLIQEGSTGSARVRLRQYMDTNGESSHPLFLMGLSYHSEKRYAKSVEWFIKSVNTQNEEYAPVWHFLGWSNYYLGDIEQAKSCFEKYLEIVADEPDSLFALGLIAMDEGDFVSAKSLFCDSIEKATGNSTIQAKAKARLADVYVELGDREKAIVLYQEAVKQHADLYEAWYRLSQALRRVQRNDEALNALHQFEVARKRIRPDLYQATRFPE